MSKYPAQIDTSLELPTVVDNFTPVRGDIFNKLRDAIFAIESELGVKPSSTYSTVRARLDKIEASTVIFDGDLFGSNILQTVIGLQGRPISSGVPGDGQALTWNASANQWEPQSSVLFNGDLSGDNVTQTVIGLQGNSISTGTPSSGQVLTWNGTFNYWEPQTPTGGGGGPPSGPASGDLTGVYPNPTVLGISDIPIEPTTRTQLQFDWTLTTHGGKAITMFAIDSSNGTMYIPCEGGIYVIPFDLDEPTPVFHSVVGLTGQPTSAVLAGTVLWVLVNGNVLRINLSDFTIEATITGFDTGSSIGNPNRMVYDFTNDYLWVTDVNDNSVKRVETISNTVDATVPFPNSFPVIYQPWDVTVGGGYVWVGTLNASDPARIYRLDPIALTLTSLDGPSIGSVYLNNLRFLSFSGANKVFCDLQSSSYPGFLIRFDADTLTYDSGADVDLSSYVSSGNTIGGNAVQDTNTIWIANNNTPTGESILIRIDDLFSAPFVSTTFVVAYTTDPYENRLGIKIEYFLDGFSANQILSCNNSFSGIASDPDAISYSHLDDSYSESFPVVNDLKFLPLAHASLTTAGVITLTGDLAGSYNSPLIGKLQSYILDLSTPPVIDDVIKWNGNAFVAGITPPVTLVGDVVGSSGANTVQEIHGNSGSLDVFVDFTTVNMTDYYIQFVESGTARNGAQVWHQGSDGVLGGGSGTFNGGEFVFETGNAVTNEGGNARAGDFFINFTGDVGTSVGLDTGSNRYSGGLQLTNTYTDRNVLVARTGFATLPYFVINKTNGTLIHRIRIGELGTAGQPASYTAAPTISTGTGSPEGVVTAVVGSLYTDLTGSTSTTLYVKTSGTGNTGWTAK